MRKHILIALVVVGIIGVGGIFSSSPASALTAEEIQSQIQQLVARIAELTKQLRALQDQNPPPATTVSEPSSARHRICSILYRNLAQGTRGDDVISLQEFLRSEGYLSANSTGYFGPATAAAVSRWQASQGISAVGSLGPLSRERIKIWCGLPGEGSGNSERFGASPQRGTAPLTVTFKTNVELANPRFVADAGEYKIVFGDGSEYVLPCSGDEPFCKGPHSVRHTYNENDTYKAQLVHFGYFGVPPPGGGLPSQVVANATIQVGATACTKEYRPVCGQKQVQCITTPCNPVQQTYGNRCTMEADGATFLHEGACRGEGYDPANDPRCKAWYDGCNSCSRETPNSPAMCTLRACTAESMTKPYCTTYFDNAGNRPPTISSFSGPTTLQLNQTGTWTIRASDPENDPLSYRVSWGDERAMSSVAPSLSTDAFVQTTTFTHAYGAAGTYTVTITVRDPGGKEARTTSTVRVGGEITYCTMDAMQCPDGRWIGRSGPNCQFDCSAAVLVPEN
jgi:peptidoglycan hydrolase-like protein with peptidoglycan-binding domain